MTDEGADLAFLWWWTAAELAFLVGVAALLVAGLLGRTATLADVSTELRLAALAFVGLELAIPLGVFLDLRRRPDAPATSGCTSPPCRCSTWSDSSPTSRRGGGPSRGE